MEHRKRKKLGELLVENQILDRKDLQKALEMQNKGQGKKLGEILMETGFITRAQLIETLEMQLGIPYISLADQLVPRDVVDLVPEEIIKEHKVFPYKYENGSIYLCMEDPLNFLAIENVQLTTGKKVIPVFTFANDIEVAAGRYFGIEEEELSAAVENLMNIKAVNLKIEDFAFNVDDLSAKDDAPVIAAVNSVIYKAISMRASDIHIEPYETELRVRYRIDGTLHEMFKFPRGAVMSVVSRLKLMAGMDIAERRAPQDGRIQIKVSNRKIDLRVSSLPTLFGEKVVIRILDKENSLIRLKELGFSNRQMDVFHSLLHYSYGMVLVVGPTGSGKTTTLYAALNEIKSVEKNIITVEDPPEYMLDGINQVQINPKIGLTFQKGLRSILRQDPDIVMVGEIRDEETADISTRAAMTGHLVLSTMHTNDAPSTLSRMADIGVPRYLIAASVNGVVAQRLVRRLCPKCRENYSVLPGSKEAIFLKGEVDVSTAKFSRPVGCPFCNNTGYKGRVALQEVMEIDKEMRKAILNTTDTQVIENMALNNGMVKMKTDGIQKALEGITSLEEVIRATYGGEF